MILVAVFLAKWDYIHKVITVTKGDVIARGSRRWRGKNDGLKKEQEMGMKGRELIAY